MMPAALQLEIATTQTVAWLHELVQATNEVVCSLPSRGTALRTYLHSQKKEVQIIVWE
jgi:hypothetical protein